jgi:sec-independent protein translocase protein TatC
LNYTDQFDQEENKMSFLDHLDAFRGHLVRSAIAIVLLAIVSFSAKAIVFDGIILAPKNINFLTYQLFCWLGEKYSLLQGLCVQEIPFVVINIDMTGQFMQHITVSIITGVIVAFPYIVWEFWRFVKPGLKKKEIKAARGMVFYISILFFVGVAFGYFLLAPLSILFLGSYQISDEVLNQITLSSYIGTLTTLVLATGLIFELPVLAYFLAQIGLITAAFLRNSRRIAIIINLILAAIITPSDVGSMVLMAIPLFLLYEVSIKVVARVEKNKVEKLKDIA